MLSKEKLKELFRLKTKKARKKEGRFLIEGLRLCQEAVDSSWHIEMVLFTPSFARKTRGKELLKRMHRLNLPLIGVKNEVLKKLSDTVTAQGIVCVVKRRKYSMDDLWKKKTGMIVALDGIRDPGNVGTLIRTADAFGVDVVLLSRDTVELFCPKVVRSTMGSIFHLPIMDEVDLGETVPELKKRKFKILGTDVAKGKSIHQLCLSGRICLLIGSEAKGLDKNLLNLSDEVIHIPTRGKAESLNVAVAGGILLYEINQRRTS